MLQKRLIFGILFSTALVLLPSCSKHHVLDVDRILDKCEYYIVNGTTTEFTLHIYDRESHYQHYLEPGESNLVKTTAADSAIVYVGESAVKKYYRVIDAMQDNTNILIANHYIDFPEKSSDHIYALKYVITDKDLELK